MTHEASLTSLFPDDIANLIREYRDVYPLVYIEEGFPQGSLSEYIEPDGEVSLGNMVHQALKTRNLFLVLKLLVWSVDTDKSFVNVSVGYNLLEKLREIILSRRQGSVLSFGFGHGYLEDIPNHTTCGCAPFPFNEIENIFILPDGQKLISFDSADCGDSGDDFDPNVVLYPEYIRHCVRHAGGNYVPILNNGTFIRFNEFDDNDEDDPSNIRWPVSTIYQSVNFKIEKSFTIKSDNEGDVRSTDLSNVESDDSMS